MENSNCCFASSWTVDLLNQSGICALLLPSILPSSHDAAGRVTVQMVLIAKYEDDESTHSLLY